MQLKEHKKILTILAALLFFNMNQIYGAELNLTEFDSIRANLARIQDKSSPQYIKTKNKLDRIIQQKNINYSKSARLNDAARLINEGKYDTAIYELRALISENYQVSKCNELLGDICIRMGREIKKAGHYYKLAYDNDNNNYVASFKLATLYIKSNKIAPGIFFIDKAVNTCNDSKFLTGIINYIKNSVHPENRLETNSLYEILGNIYQKLGQKEEAYKAYKVALQLNPDDIYLKYLLGDLYYCGNNDENAVLLYNDILKENPNETAIRISKAKALLGMGNLIDADKEYREILADNPSSIQAKYGLYKIYERKLSPDKILEKINLNPEYKATRQDILNFAKILEEANDKAASDNFKNYVRRLDEEEKARIAQEQARIAEEKRILEQQRLEKQRQLEEERNRILLAKQEKARLEEEKRQKLLKEAQLKKEQEQKLLAEKKAKEEKLLKEKLEKQRLLKEKKAEEERILKEKQKQIEEEKRQKLLKEAQLKKEQEQKLLAEKKAKEEKLLKEKLEKQRLLKEKKSEEERILKEKQIKETEEKQKLLAERKAKEEKLQKEKKQKEYEEKTILQEKQKFKTKNPKKYSQYEAEIKKYMNIEPKDAKTYVAIGNTYKMMEMPTSAIKYYKEAMKLDPVDSDIYYNLGLTYMELNSYVTSKTNLIKALDLDKNNSKAKNLLGFVNQKIITQTLNKAYAEFEAKNYIPAFEILDKGIKEYPNNEQMYYYRALIFDKMNRNAAQIIDLQKAIELNPGYYMAYYQLGYAYEKIKDERGALYAYEKFLSTEPDEKELVEEVQKKVEALSKKYY